MLEALGSLSRPVKAVMASLVAQHEVVQRVGAAICQTTAVVNVQRLTIEQVDPTCRASSILSVRHDPV